MVPHVDGSLHVTKPIEYRTIPCSSTHYTAAIFLSRNKCNILTICSSQKKNGRPSVETIFVVNPSFCDLVPVNKSKLYETPYTCHLQNIVIQDRFSSKRAQ